MKRSNSTIELLRIFLLFFLISWHWLQFQLASYIDTDIIMGISVTSVTGFALITGMFVFSKRSLLFRNVSRLMFIILISIIIGFSTFLALGKSFSGNFVSIFSGSRDSWYLYAIVGVYLVGPFLSKLIERMRWFGPAVIGIMIICLMEIARIVTPAASLVSGSPYSFVYLFAISLIGNSIGRMPMSRKSINISFSIIASLSLFGIVMVGVFANWKIFDHDFPTTIFLAISLVALAKFNPFYSKKLNWLVKRLYFVYEYHWYWQIIWYTVFAGFIKDHPHLQLYVNWIVIFLFGSVMSMIITEIQLKVWNKYVDPQMLKAISWTKSKLMSPKVSN